VTAFSPGIVANVKVGFANINAKAEGIGSFAIVTTTPNAPCGEIHNRMPVILKPETWPVWLGEESADAPQLKALLVPYPVEEMIAWPVGARVGNVKNNDPGLIEPLAAAG
jgi:putative SOS response-associated peptidase YedK